MLVAVAGCQLISGEIFICRFRFIILSIRNQTYFAKIYYNCSCLKIFSVQNSWMSSQVKVARNQNSVTKQNKLLQIFKILANFA
jgi:hypothetical protein